MPDEQDDGLLTVEEVASRLGTGERFARRLIAERRIEYVKVGRHDDIIDRNPCRLRGAGTEKPAERPTLTIRQVQQLCMEVPPRFSAFIAVKTFGSLRWGEITALHRRDVDSERGVITVRAAYVERSNGELELGPPKSRASARQIVLPDPVLQMLVAHLDAYVPSDPAPWSSPDPADDRCGGATSTAVWVGSA